MIRHGRRLGPDGVHAERQPYEQVFFEDRLKQALVLLNSGLPNEAIKEAFRKLIRPEEPILEIRNRAFHRMLVDGVTVELLRGTPVHRLLLFAGDRLGPPKACL